MGMNNNTPQALPQISPLERADLSRLAKRTFADDEAVYRFWHELVTEAAFFHMFEERLERRSLQVKRQIKELP
jgi:hypothetical protein